MRTLDLSIVKLLAAAGIAGSLAACSGSEPPASAEAAPEAAEVAATEMVEAVAASSNICVGSGPQSPRDITSMAGTNPVVFPTAPPASEMNLCNIHSHTSAEHKGPDFSIKVEREEHAGFACNATAELTEAELAAAPGAFGSAVPGDTVEFHWVHTTCPTSPGPGLGACVPEGCSDPLLRVEAQTFLLVNDPNALDFADFAYAGAPNADGLHQAKAIPSDTGTPVSYLGSTTGPSYTEATCSPAQVSWSVRPMCAKLDINSLHRWAEAGNVFEETDSHEVRELVESLELLSAMN